MIYAYHTFVRGGGVPVDKYRRSEVDFREDIRKMGPEDEIHVDDAMSSALEVGIPILMKEFRTATFFVPAEKVGQDGFWTPAQLLEISKHFEIGSHGYEHVDLRTLPLGEVEIQLQKSIDLIESWIGHKPVKFVAPYEGYNQEIIEVARRLGLVPILGRQTVYNTTELQAPMPAISSVEYWDDIFMPKAEPLGMPKKEPGGHEQERYDEVLKLLGPQGPVVDVGAGWAGLAKGLKKMWPDRKVEALDQSRQAALRAGFQPYHVASCYQMPFVYKEFEFLVTCQMLEYVEDNHRALNEFARVANFAIITVPNGKHTTCSQLREYSLESLKEILKLHGEVELYRAGAILVAKIKF